MNGSGREKAAVEMCEMSDAWDEMDLEQGCVRNRKRSRRELLALFWE